MTVTPFEQAAIWHIENTPEGGMTFAQVIESHLMSGGYLFSTPHVFLLGRPIRSDWDEEQINDPAYVAPRSMSNCWHVWLCAGDFHRAIQMIPYPLPYISFHRKNRFALYRIKRLLGIIGQ